MSTPAAKGLAAAAISSGSPDGSRYRRSRPSANLPACPWEAR